MNGLKKIIFLLCLLTLTITVNAQITVTGTVTDEIGKPIEFASAVILNPITDKIVQGVLTDSLGVFRLKAIENKQFMLQISFVGFNSYITEVDNSMDLGKITLTSDNSLDEVIIYATRQLLKKQGDKLVMDIRNNELLKGRNALEILKYAPYLSIDATSGSISMKGKTSTILVNGRNV